MNPGSLPAPFVGLGGGDRVGLVVDATSQTPDPAGPVGLVGPVVGCVVVVVPVTLIVLSMCVGGLLWQVFGLLVPVGWALLLYTSGLSTQ